MAHPISNDLRRRVVESVVAEGWTTVDAASHFRVSQSSVSLWCKRYRETGSYEALPHSGGRPTQKIFEPQEQALCGWLDAQPDLTNAELAEKFEAQFGTSITDSQISRVMKRLKYTRKKKTGSSSRRPSRRRQTSS